MKRHVAWVLLVVSCAAFAQAKPEPAPAPAPAEDARANFAASLKPQAGQIALPGGLAALNLPDDLRYLDKADTKRLLEEGWGNPPGAADDTLGMIVPAGADPVAEGGWGVVITYNNDGHVSDSDASSIDYASVLKDMQAAVKESSEERVKKGYAAITLAGWAEAPHYDATAHKIYWAKDLAFGDDPNHTLNYCIRVLGREGVLELNAVAGLSQLAMVKDRMQQVVASADFTKGNGYGDFNQSTDKLAAYGLAALVAGGVAAKTGLLAKLFALLLAAKKLIVLALAGIATFFGKLFKKKSAGTAPG